jgi:hypothetical protein
VCHAARRWWPVRAATRTAVAASRTPPSHPLHHVPVGSPHAHWTGRGVAPLWQAERARDAAEPKPRQAWRQRRAHGGVAQLQGQHALLLRRAHVRTPSLLAPARCCTCARHSHRHPAPSRRPNAALSRERVRARGRGLRLRHVRFFSRQVAQVVPPPPPPLSYRVGSTEADGVAHTRSVHACEPDHGRTSGDSTITVLGANFGNVGDARGALRVFINGVACAHSRRVSDTLAVCVTPPGPAGAQVSPSAASSTRCPRSVPSQCPNRLSTPTVVPASAASLLSCRRLPPSPVELATRRSNTAH